MHPILAFCPYLSLNKPIEFADWRLGPLSAFEDLWADAKFKLHAQAFLAKFVNHSGEPIERPSIICRRNGQVDGKPPTGQDQRALELAIGFAFLDRNARRDAVVKATGRAFVVCAPSHSRRRIPGFALY